MDRSKATSQREMGMSRRAFEETVRVLRQHFASAGLKKN
jgi:hypothetical protein